MLRPLVLLLALASAPTALAQHVFVAPLVGYNLDAESPLVGLAVEVEVLHGVTPFHLGVRPSVEVEFAGDIEVPGGRIEEDVVQANLDALAIRRVGPLALDAGVGLAVIRVTESLVCDDGTDACGEPHGDGHDDGHAGEHHGGTDVGLNLFGGIEAPGGRLVPFAEARVTLTDGSAVAVLGGVKIGL